MIDEGISDIKQKLESEKPATSYLTIICIVSIIAMVTFTYIKVNRMLKKAAAF